MKRILSVLLCVTLMMTLFVPTAFAKTAEEQAYHKLTKQVEKANKEIAKMVRTAQRTPENDVAWLIASTNAVAQSVMDAAAQLGITVVCDMETYYVDGQYVEIDPLRVIPPKPSNDKTN